MPETKYARSGDIYIAYQVTGNGPVDLVLAPGTAAPPGQGGHDHVNEQPPSYWISKFQAPGFAYDEELSRLWREKAVVAWWYFQNLMIFRRIGSNLQIIEDC